jgi:phosphoglycolate phosphatase
VSSTAAPDAGSGGARGGLVRAVLCDLDGTLLDTAPDLAVAINAMLAELGLPPRRAADIAHDIGQGTPRLVERSLRAANATEMCRPERLQHALDLFSRHYEQVSGQSSRPFPGVEVGLQLMSHSGFALACVTNKPRRFTLPLLARTGLEACFRTVVCGDEVGRLKPDPQPYAEACARLGVNPREAVVIGDSANDVTAGRAAGCAVICVPYGYREGLSADALGADGLVFDFIAAVRWIRARNAAAHGAAA